MSKLEKILALVRSINEDEFQEQLTHGDSLDDVYEELLFLAKKIESKKKRTGVIIEQISNCFAGDFFNYLPISEENDELDVFCMGFNTYIEELKSAMVSKKLLETINGKLAEAKERTEQLVFTKDQFLSGMSHEIRTPLNGIIGFADLLLNSPSLDTESKEQLEYIKMSADVLMVTINDILDLAKIESGQVVISDKPFNLIELTRLLREIFSVKIADKEIDLQLVIDEEVPSLLCGDSVRVSQILFNLMSHAIKLTPVNGKIRLKIKLQDEEEGSYSVRITVKDSGIGMTAKQLEGIFDPFVQVSNDVVAQNEGTGLGLTIVKKIVNLMNGEIVVKSKANLGTKFTVTLPFSKITHYSSSSESSLENENKVSVSVDSSKKMKVLLAEDDRINQILVQKVLSNYNIDCVAVGNGRLAVDALIQDDFDLVLMDLMMPVLNGYEAASEIRKLKNHSKKNIPILALSAVVTDTVVNVCKTVGIDEYLSKPFDSEELYNVITELIVKKNNFV